MIDLTTIIGGRTVTPALSIVDGSSPTPTELSFQNTLDAYIANHVPLENEDGIRTRERVLVHIGTMHREWVKVVATKRGLNVEAVKSAGGELFTSGSYRLGVHEPGADIDCIAVAPNMCTREDFFGSGYIPPEGSYNNNDDDDEDASIPTRDPDSLAERIRRHPDVTNFVAIETAAVPILTFDFEGVNIDLLFARLASPSVPPGIDIDNDAVLSGVDASTEKSLNGPRVTNLIAALARSGSEERYRTFLTVVRLVRKWAKARGLYSNKMGYWGGVNINIAVALVLQLYPNACPASCLRRFFLVFKSWRWPNPVMLTKPHDAELGLSVWNSHQAATMRQVAPMITPAYPAMNSTLSISRQTLQILHEEFCRGHAIVDKLYKDYQRGDILDDDDVASGEMWRELFEPSDFFIGYPHYLSLCIVGPTQQDAQSWAGFVESRLRKLVSDMLGRSLPLSKVQLWPKKFDACVADRTALLTHAQRANSITYFVGFRVDTLRMRGSQLDVERQLANFRNYELSRFYPLIPGMDILPRSFTVKELPTICFDSYEGGKVSAMKRRRMLIEADPKRQEAQNKKKLAKLKKKMEAIQRKKREAVELASSSARNVKSEGGENHTGDDETGTEVDIVDSLHKKRKREDDEGNALDEDDDEEEEAALLENALDAIEGEGSERKTREEAEIDRIKLLAGELLGDGEDEPTEEQSGNVKLDQGDRKLTRQEIEAEILRRAGLVLVSDDEATILGGNRILPWRHGYKRTIVGVKKEESSINDLGTDQKFSAETVQKAMPRRVRTMIKFNTKFDVVELDAAGRVIDKGDDDFMPSQTWIGRKGGFEFKLGERGVGYYRTGKRVIVPSNMSYS